mgnify:CR=1 FL=1
MTIQPDAPPTLAAGHDAGTDARRPALSDRAGEALLRRFLGGIVRTGTLRLRLPSGRCVAIGGGSPQVGVRLTSPATVWRLLTNPELALGEAYMDGTLVMEQGSIYDLLALALANMGGARGPGLMRLNAALRKAMRRFAQHNPVARARANVAHHYDLSDELYELFLDGQRQYSCAYFTASDDTLDQAQDNKIRHIAAKLLLRPGQRVLDIGSGWGGLAIRLAQGAGVGVTGLTLSAEQHRHATDRAAEAGVQDHVSFHLRDYREEEGRYDRIVSVGMFEHVGVPHYRAYFDRIARMLAEDGVALVHTIGAAHGPSAANPWIAKYIFPGGYVPALSEIMPAIERAGLHVTDIEVLRLHYARTLRAWRDRFMARRERAAALYDDRFCRMWEFYLASCEAAFRHSGLVVFQIQLARRVDAVPITRDYIAAAERPARGALAEALS